jgi:hypothetical protein
LPLPFSSLAHRLRIENHAFSMFQDYTINGRHAIFIILCYGYVSLNYKKRKNKNKKHNMPQTTRSIWIKCHIAVGIIWFTIKTRNMLLWHATPNTISARVINVNY